MLKRLLYAILVLCGFSVLTNAQEPPPGSPEEMCYLRGGNWDNSRNQCALQISLEINIDVPLTFGDNPDLQAMVDTFLQDYYQTFIMILAEPIPVSAPYTLTITHEEFYFSDDIQGLVFSIYEYTGGAHPNTYYKTFTFDVTQNVEVTFMDVFAPDADVFATIKPLVQAQIQETLGEMLDEQWLEDGTGENPANYQHFALTMSELILYFPPYQVAPYAAGSFVVRLPLSDLEAILADDFLR